MRRDICVVVMVVLLGVASAQAQVNMQNTAANASQSTSDVFVFGTQTPVVPASSTLTRTGEGAAVLINTSGLTPHNAYSVWWVVFNRPERCASVPCSAADLGGAAQTSVLWAAGRVADDWGQAVISAHLAPGQAEGLVLNGNGLTSPQRAEMHLLIRDHGAASANPATLQQQLTTPVQECAAAPNCDVQAVIHLP